MSEATVDTVAQAVNETLALSQEEQYARATRKGRRQIVANELRRARKIGQHYARLQRKARRRANNERTQGTTAEMFEARRQVRREIAELARSAGG